MSTGDEQHEPDTQKARFLMGEFMQPPSAEYWEPPEADSQWECTCGVLAPDEFGNRDLLDDPSCPVHGEEA